VTLNKENLYYCSPKLFITTFFLLFILQIIFWYKTENIKPDVYIVPPLPSKYAVEALSLGDKQFYFRILAQKIENAGDIFGRFSALKNYDYLKLYKWFKLLDTLDSKSKYVPTLAANYYSQTQNHQDTRYIVQYLDEYASQDIDENWWFLWQATYIANFILKDHKLGLDLAYKLSKNNAVNAPFWTKQIPAFIQAKLGKDCAAFLFINRLLKENELGARKISTKEMDFMRHFIKERLASLKKKNFNPKLCK
jgi:hypothetical protein